MKNARRQLAARAALLAATSLAAIAPAASAGTTDLTWQLDQTTTTYGAPSYFSISTGGSAVDYRWIDTLTKDTVISANTCSDYSLYGSAVIGAGDTSYKRLFNGSAGQCFVVRGRVVSGQGATTTRTGRISR